MVLKIEVSLRLPTFREDVPIVLGNREAFHFRPPRFIRYPEFTADGQVIECVGINYGKEWETRYDETLDKLDKKEPVYMDLIWFADRMLRENYHEDIRKYYKDLLYYTNREPDSVRWLGEIWDLARGYDPKERVSDGSKQRSGATG